MRSIGTIAHQEQAERLSFYLKKEGIENHTEGNFEPSGFISYQIWVHDEDDLPRAFEIFQEFIKDPNRGKYPPPPPPEPTPSAALKEEMIREKALGKFRTPFTTFIILLCSLIYFLNAIQMYSLRKEGLTQEALFMTPINALFLFDLPPVFEKLEALLQKHQVALDEDAQEVPPEVQEQLRVIEKTPFWQGAYPWVMMKIKGKDTALIEGPLFYQIRQGEVWRLFTPCLLHGGLLHILFNMIWVWVLGRPIEERIGIFKTALLTLLCGIIPNVVQYLMSGPFFLGYSGIVMGLAGFTWMRERRAPWEGYPLNRTTILFLLFFVGTMFALQLASFILQAFTAVEFEPNIANSAHIAGAVVGALLGRLSYFSWRVK